MARYYVSDLQAELDARFHALLAEQPQDDPQYIVPRRWPHQVPPERRIRPTQYIENGERQ